LTTTLKFAYISFQIKPYSVSETYNDKSGQKVEQTEWHNIVLWGKLAEIAEKYLHKGSAIYLEGKIRSRSYDKENQKRYITEIIGESFQMLDKKGDGKEGGTNGEVPSNVSNTPETVDDLPF
jgi:single-strand DNA-binding protein